MLNNKDHGLEYENILKLTPYLTFSSLCLSQPCSKKEENKTNLPSDGLIFSFKSGKSKV